jgi:hypothetical protein
MASELYGSGKVPSVGERPLSAWPTVLGPTMQTRGQQANKLVRTKK